MIRLHLNLFLESLTSEELSFLEGLKAKSQDPGNDLNEIYYHTCGHFDGTKCKDKVPI